jgi:hypothetical protein
VLRFPCGDCLTGSLEVISSTGGLLRLSKPLIRGTRIKMMFLTQSGPVLGTAEMLTPISWTEQAFRFVTLAPSDQRRLQAMTGCSLEPDMSKLVRIGQQVDTEHQWIDKYRDAVSRNPPPMPLFKRMREAIMPGAK